MNTIKIITTVLLIAVAIMSMGCGDDPVAPQTNIVNDPPPADPPSPEVDGVSRQLVGLWLITDATVDGRPTALSEALEWSSNTAAAAFLIEADGYYAYAEFDQDLEIIDASEGSVSSDGSRFSVSTSDFGYSGTWTRSGNILTLNATVEGSSVKLISEYVDTNDQGGVSIAR